MNRLLSILTVINISLLISLTPNITKGQIFNQYHLILNDYEISDGVDRTIIKSEFKVSEKYKERGDDVTIFTFGYTFNSVMHSKQIMVVELQNPITGLYDISNFFSEISKELDNDGFHANIFVPDSGHIIYYDKTIPEDPEVYIKGRVKMHRHRVYFVTSEITGDIDSGTASKWQNEFFNSTLVNRSSVNPLFN